VTVLVLDLDGVVVLGHKDGGRWDKDIARDLGIRPELLQRHFFHQQAFLDVSEGRGDLFELLDRVWPLLECEACDPRRFVDYWFTSHSRLDEAVLAEVASWRASGREAFLGTVQEHHRARYLWHTLRLEDHFDGMLYSAALGARKPNAAFFERAREKLGVAASEILFLDDLMPCVEAARAQGWRAFLHTGVEDLRRAIASLPSAAGI
jgi:putative hydrolase of the HAD superfamily